MNAVDRAWNAKHPKMAKAARWIGIGFTALLSAWFLTVIFSLARVFAG